MSIVKTFKTLTEDEFYERFNPIKNHFYANPEDCSFGGCMFETYGKEVEYINNIQRMQQSTKTLEELLSRRQIWTIEEVDGRFYYVSGYHYVNRYGYLLTEELVPENIEYDVNLDTETELKPMSKATFVKEITVDDLNGNPVEMEVYQHENGGLFAIDSSYLEQVSNDEPVIPDPFASKFCKLHLEGNN